MQIELRDLLPIPLKEKLLTRPSAIWNCERIFLPGQLIKIEAPSGSGKTTLVNILYKLRHDYEGEILWEKQNARSIKNDALAKTRRQKISIVFQDLQLFEHLTARENIELKRVLQQPFYPKEKIDEMAAALNITHILNQQAGTCSYGEQQRIAIIRALMQPFEWLILDEPFSHLDIDNTKKAAALITNECLMRNAGLIVTGLNEDHYFNYTNVYSL